MNSHQLRLKYKYTHSTTVYVLLLIKEKANNLVQKSTNQQEIIAKVVYLHSLCFSLQASFSSLKKNHTNLVLLQIVVKPFTFKYQLELRVLPFLHISTHYCAFMEPLYNKSYINNRCDDTQYDTQKQFYNQGGLTFFTACQGFFAKQCAVSKRVPASQFAEIGHTMCRTQENSPSNIYQGVHQGRSSRQIDQL